MSIDRNVQRKKMREELAELKNAAIAKLERRGYEVRGKTPAQIRQLSRMSALGHKRTYAVQKGTSALPPKADMCGALTHVRFVPKADIAERDWNVR